MCFTRMCQINFAFPNENLTDSIRILYVEKISKGFSKSYARQNLSEKQSNTHKSVRWRHKSYKCVLFLIFNSFLVSAKISLLLLF